MKSINNPNNPSIRIKENDFFLNILLVEFNSIQFTQILVNKYSTITRQAREKTEAR
jgi:hypothetical protein